MTVEQFADAHDKDGRRHRVMRERIKAIAVLERRHSPPLRPPDRHFRPRHRRAVATHRPAPDDDRSSCSFIEFAADRGQARIRRSRQALSRGRGRARQVRRLQVGMGGCAGLGGARSRTSGSASPPPFPIRRARLLLSARTARCCPPRIGEGGIELWAVCGRTAHKADEPSARPPQEESAPEGIRASWPSAPARTCVQTRHIEYPLMGLSRAPSRRPAGRWPSRWATRRASAPISRCAPGASGSDTGHRSFVLYGDPDVLANARAPLGLAVPVGVSPPCEAAGGVVPPPARVADAARAGRPGRRRRGQCCTDHRGHRARPPSAVAARRSRRRDQSDRQARAASIAHFAYPGHTEFLAELAEHHQPGTAPHPVMMLASDELRVVPLTVHIPLADVPKAITRKLISRHRSDHRGCGSARGFRHRSARASRSPASTRMRAKAAASVARISTSSPRPSPALRASGLDVTGPHPADTLFHAGRAQNLRCRHRHVSRPGADPDQDARLRPRRQRHARPAVRAHLARPRHRLRPRRHRQGAPGAASSPRCAWPASIGRRRAAAHHDRAAP